MNGIMIKMPPFFGGDFHEIHYMDAVYFIISFKPLTGLI